MKVLKLRDITKLLNIKNYNGENIKLKYVTNDINKLGNNTLVFHLNKHVEMDASKVLNYKSCFIISDQPLLTNMESMKNKFLYVLNIEEAYKKFVHFYRDLFEISIVAVTGTCGKTTTKEMIAQILKNNYNVVHTNSSKNALHYYHDYLMSFDDSTDYGVFETAITHPGHLILGCDYFKPTIGIITTIGIDHLNGCKTLNNYIRTKGEMLAGLQNRGTLIINNDDDNIKKLSFENYEGKVITFGIKNPSDFFAKDIKYYNDGMKFILVYNNQIYNAFVPGYGIHNVYNALAALAALTMLGKDLNESIKYLSKFKHIRSHVEVKKGINDSIIIDDTWSSNPTSMNAALKVLSEKGKGKVKIAVIGKISYLGDFDKHYYKEIAKMLIENKVDYLLTKDVSAEKIGQHALSIGMNPNSFIACKDTGEINRKLKSLLNENTIVLFKVSMLDKTYKNILNDVII